MAITYPLAFPTHTGVRSIELRASNSVSFSQSPFTFQGQALHWGGEMWMLDVTLPPMKRADAEVWVAWLVSLRGQYGRFLAGDSSSSTIRGTATTVTVSGSAGDSSVTVVSNGTLKAGDMIQIGGASDATLHKVLADKSGSGTLEIWPALRKNRSSATVFLNNASGVFRLSSNETSWSVNEASIYGLSFSAMEAV